MSNKILKISTVILVGAHLFCLMNINECEAMDQENDERQVSKTAWGCCARRGGAKEQENGQRENKRTTNRGSVSRGGTQAQENTFIRDVGITGTLGFGGYQFWSHFGTHWLKGVLMERASEACRLACSTDSYAWQALDWAYRPICTSISYEALAPNVEKGIALAVCALPAAYITMRKIGSIVQAGVRCCRPMSEDEEF